MKKNNAKNNANDTNIDDVAKKGNDKEKGKKKEKLSKLEQLAKLCPPDLYEKLADKTYIGSENPRLVYPETYDPDKPIPVTTEGGRPIIQPNNYLLFRKLENNLDLSNLAQPTPKTMEMIDVVKRQIQLVTRCNVAPSYNRRFSTPQELLDFFSQWLILCGDVGIIPNIRLFCLCASINYVTFFEEWYRKGRCGLEMHKAVCTIVSWFNTTEETMAVTGQLDSKIYQFHSINRSDMIATKAEATIHAVSEAEITPEEIAARLPEL